MKIRMEEDANLDEVEIVIRAPQRNAELERIQQAISQLYRPSITFYKGRSEYFLKLEDLLFFETDGTKVVAHSRKEVYEVKLKLYELEACLPNSFCRISKSAIVNIHAIYSLDKSFSGTSRIRFAQTPKEVHVSRHYYHLLKTSIQEMR